MRLNEIAGMLDCELVGDSDIEIVGVAPLEDAKSGDLSFLANMKYAPVARRTNASAVIATPECGDLGRPLLKHSNPYLAFAKAIEIFHTPAASFPSIHSTAWISDSARVGRGVSIGAFSFIGDDVTLGDLVTVGCNCTIEEGVQLGAGTIVHSGSVIRQNVRIGANCIIQANSVVGSDGFGFAKTESGAWYRILPVGTVTLGDDVEVGACTTVDRATLGETTIDSGTKLDNLVQIGHACTVGRNSLLCAQVGLAGSTHIGNGVILAGQVGAAGHLRVGDGGVVTAQSGLGDDVEPGGVVSGSPAFDNKKWLRATALFTRLPDIQRTLKDLERRVISLENK